MNCKFANISFVGTAALIKEMGEVGNGTYISQVVPSPSDTSVALVKECTELLGHEPTYGELEGFLDAKVLVEGLQKAGSDLTRGSFVSAMESLSAYDAGGVVISYGVGDHQGLDKIYLTKVQGGKAIPIDKLQ